MCPADSASPQSDRYQAQQSALFRCSMVINVCRVEREETGVATGAGTKFCHYMSKSPQTWRNTSRRSKVSAELIWLPSFYTIGTIVTFKNFSMELWR